MVRGGLAQVGGKAHTSSAVQFSPPLAPSRLRTSKVFLLHFCRFVARLSVVFYLFLFIFTSKKPHFCPFRKKLSTIGIFTLNPFIYRLLRPLLLVFIHPFADRRFGGLGGAKNQPRKSRKKAEKTKQKIKNKTPKRTAENRQNKPQNSKNKSSNRTT